MLPRGLIKEYFQLLTFFLRLLDVAMILVGGLWAYVYRFNTFYLPSSYCMALVIAGLSTPFIFRFFNVYTSLRTQQLWIHLNRLLQSTIVLFVFLACFAFISKTGDWYSRVWVSYWILFSFLLLFISRILLILFLRMMRSKGWNERRILLIGTGDLAHKLIEAVQQSVWTGCRIVAVLSDDKEAPAWLKHIPVSNIPHDISQYLMQLKEPVDEIWLALPLSELNRIKHILYLLRHEAITTRCALDIFDLELLNHSVTDFSGIPMLNVRSSPMVGLNRLIKAMEDRTLAAFILVLISPLLLLIAVLVKCSSRGPVFYKQKRVGWNGKEFEMLKFRTMPVNTEDKTGPVWAKQGEARATRTGAFLRRTSLDELPQFINVLRGDMSIVGPRPERAYFVAQFKEQIPRYMQKHMVKAGITGWAQVNGWRGNTSLQKRIEYDLFYIENWSFAFDIKIICMTFLRGFINKNAY